MVATIRSLKISVSPCTYRVRKEKQDQEDPLGRVDYREIQVSEVLLVHLDPRVLRVRQEYRGFKA